VAVCEFVVTMKSSCINTLPVHLLQYRVVIHCKFPQGWWYPYLLQKKVRNLSSSSMEGPNSLMSNISVVKGLICFIFIYLFIYLFIMCIVHEVQNIKNKHIKHTSGIKRCKWNQQHE